MTLRLSISLAVPLFVALLLFSMPLHAACTSPAGTEGELIYNADYHVLQFCDGTRWVSTASSGQVTPAGGSAGTVQYNTGTTFGGSTNLLWDNSNARLGINSATPAKSLDVVGTAGITGNTTIGGTLGVTGAVTGASFSGVGTALTALNASNLASGTVGTARLGSGTANSSSFLRGDSTWTALTGSQWTTSGSNIYYTTGLVGIGTATPGEICTSSPQTMEGC